MILGDGLLSPDDLPVVVAQVGGSAATSDDLAAVILVLKGEGLSEEVIVEP